MINLNILLHFQFEGLGTLVIGLQTTSFVIIVLTTVSTIWTMYRERDGNDDGGCSCKGLSTSMIYFYPFAGNLNEYQRI